jgi:diadenosine tetraphosphatase ApaH/serine/threonine PP2A family protein phosphatase
MRRGEWECVRVTRVAVLADVNGNPTALEAVAREVIGAAPDVVVFLGDLTWGPLPEATWQVALDLRNSFVGRTLFLRGNTERALSEARHGRGLGELTQRARWMLAQHSASTLDAFDRLPASARIDIEQLGRTRFCHGSPRSDEELITPATPSERMRELLADVPERILVSAHTHVQFDRFVDGVRSVNPGSVGIPYQGASGAYWAILGPDVQLCRTEYDLDVAIARYRGSNDPLVDAMVKTLVEPPTLGEVIANAEALEFSV